MVNWGYDRLGIPRSVHADPSRAPAAFLSSSPNRSPLPLLRKAAAREASNHAPLLFGQLPHPGLKLPGGCGTSPAPRRATPTITGWAGRPLWGPPAALQCPPHAEGCLFNTRWGPEPVSCERTRAAPCPGGHTLPAVAKGSTPERSGTRAAGAQAAGCRARANASGNL